MQLEREERHKKRASFPASREGGGEDDSASRMGPEKGILSEDTKTGDAGWFCFEIFLTYIIKPLLNCFWGKTSGIPDKLC
jgi:hypothetical protein